MIERYWATIADVSLRRTDRRYDPVLHGTPTLFVDLLDDGPDMLNRRVRWSERSFVNDLLRLYEAGVRGSVEVYDPRGGWMKYELADDAVNRYDAEIVYLPMPDEQYRNQDDLPE